MLSMTDTDARISLATPDDVKTVTTQTLNIWAGALSPLWLPFWAASSAGIGLWGLSQAVKRGFGNLPDAGDTVLAAKWPGFALTLPAPAAKAVEDVVVEAPKAAAKTVKKAVETIAEVVEDAPEVLTEAANTAIAVSEDTAQAVRDEIAETVAEATAETVAACTPLIDPVTEVPVIPEVVEDAAETDLFKPLSAKVAPRRGKKR